MGQSRTSPALYVPSDPLDSLPNEDKIAWLHKIDALARAEDTKKVMSQPTLYRALRRLEERGAVTSEWESLDDAAAAGREGRPRRYYFLTTAGAELAATELRAQELCWASGRLVPNTN